MKKITYKTAFIFSLFLALASCKEEKKEDKKDLKEQLSYEKTEVLENVEITHGHHFMTKEDQTKTTPSMVIEELEAGNERFKNGDYTARDHSKAITQAIEGQYPKAYILSCIDSRVPVEDVFDQGIGDLFVGRVAGNFVNTDQLGSMEYAAKVAGAKVIMVLGHQNCGAIKGVIDDVKLGNLTELLAKIKPAVAMTEFHGEKSSKNKEFVREVSLNNVKYTIEQIRKRSSVLKEMEDKGEIKIVGAFYSLKDGHMEYIK